MEITNDNKEEQAVKKEVPSKLDELKSKILTEDKSKLNIKILLAKTKEHIESVRAEVLKYTGKPGYNPYVWLKLNNFSLAEEIIKSPESFDETTISTILTKVLNTKAEPPVVNNPLIPSAREVNKILKSK